MALSVTVTAGETRYLVFFAASYDWCDTGEFAAAVDSAERYAANFSSAVAAQSAGLFGGIPEADVPLVANWTFPEPEPDPEPAPSPEPTPAIPRFTG